MRGLAPILRAEARDALVFTSSTLINRVGAFLLLPLFLSKLSPEDFGILAVIAVVGAFQMLIGSLSLDLAVTRLYYEWPEAERRRNLGSIWVWSWIATFGSGALFLVVMPFLAPFLFPDVPYEPSLPLGIISNALAGLLVLPATTIRIRRLPWLFAVYSVASFVVTGGLGLWFVLGLDLGLGGYLSALILANTALASLSILVMLRFSRPSITSSGLAGALRFSVPALPSALISTFGVTLDRILLAQFATLHTLGIYAVAMKFVELIGALHQSLKMTFIPFTMQHMAADVERGRQLVGSVIPFYLIPYLAATLGLVLFIGPVVRIIDQPEYFPVVEWVPWLAGAYLIACLFVYFGNGMLLANRTYLLTIPAAAQLAAMTVTGFLLIPPFQLAGVVATRYAGAIVLFGSSLYLSRRVFRIEHRWAVLLALAGALLLFAASGSVLTPSDAALEIIARAAVWAVFLIVALSIVVGGKRVTHPGPAAP
ncbi:MAG: lipopolysaccharide biosynthesis protein [Chloroflexi bacterium]|nr:lipopolysaccharide biosynthesis protein [Chloroflexota bacterium]